MRQTIDLLSLWAFMAGKFVAPLAFFALILSPLYSSPVFSRLTGSFWGATIFCFLWVLAWRRWRAEDI